MFVPNRELGNFLIDARVISRADLARAQEEAGETPLFDVLLTRNVVPEDELRRAAAHVLGVPFKEARHEDIEPEALLLVPEPLARNYSLAVVATRAHEAEVLLLDLDDLSRLAFLEREHHVRLRPHLTDRASIKRALLIHQKHLKERFATKFKSANTDEALEALLSHAMLSRAQEVYLDHLEVDLRVRYRIHGTLVEAMRVPMAAPALIHKLKELAGFSFTLHTPQEGRFKAELKNGERVRVGVFSLRTQGGESVMLTLARNAVSRRGFSLESLGLHGESAEALRSTLAHPSGLMLVAAPKGNGKTTTLYTLLDLLSGPHGLSVSVEEKIELLLPHVLQVEVKKELGLTVASTLRAALKHHPDVLMISEIKDEETALLAASAAARGIVVLAGIKAPTAEKAMQKLLSLDIDPLMLSATLSGVVANRVVRKLCQHCKEAHATSRAQIASLEEQAHFGRVLAALKAEGVVEGGMQWKDVKFFKAKGCAECDGGYQGTVGIFEVLSATAITKQFISDPNKKEENLPTPAQVGDMPLNIVEDGLFKAAAGQTSLEEVEKLAI